MNTPVVPGRQPATTAATIPRRWPRSATSRTQPPRRSSLTGDGRSKPMTATCSRPRWESSSPTPSGSTTCTGMYGSGAQIGTARNTTPRPPQTTQPAQNPAMTVSFGAVPGSAGRTTPVPPFATGARQTSGASARGSAFPGLSIGRVPRAQPTRNRYIQLKVESL